MQLSAVEIAKAVNGQVIGRQDAHVSNVATIEEANDASLCFISNKKYTKFLATTKAAIVIVGKDINTIPEGKTVVQCDHPYVAFCTMLITHFDYTKPQKDIHPRAVVSETAKIGKNVHLGANCFIGDNVVIGDNSKIHANTCIYENSIVGINTTIYPNVSIYYDTHIGSNCIIHSGTTIGSDGFGHAPMPDGTYTKIPQIGNVVIGDAVEIGANCAIDRANMGSTIIADGCRLDNLIQIAHGVKIGKHTVIAGQSGIAGSTEVGEHVVIAAQVGIVGHIKIGSKSLIGAQSGVTKGIKEGEKVTDSPHLPISTALKSRVLYRNLPQLEQRIRDLENKLKTND